jgi:hypothetical protein
VIGISLCSFHYHHPPFAHGNRCSIFHAFRAMRNMDTKLFYLPVVVIHVVLWGFFFAVLGVYSLDGDPEVRAQR